MAALAALIVRPPLPAERRTENVTLSLRRHDPDQVQWVPENDHFPISAPSAGLPVDFLDVPQKNNRALALQRLFSAAHASSRHGIGERWGKQPVGLCLDRFLAQGSELI